LICSFLFSSFESLLILSLATSFTFSIVVSKTFLTLVNTGTVFIFSSFIILLLIFLSSFSVEILIVFFGCCCCVALSFASDIILFCAFCVNEALLYGKLFCPELIQFIIFLGCSLRSFLISSTFFSNFSLFNLISLILFTFSSNICHFSLVISDIFFLKKSNFFSYN